MSVSNGVISAPVSIDDVNNTLGHGSTDLGTLCQSSKINKWAKYKPVRLAQIAPSETSEWWKADDGFCGLKVPVVNGTNISQLETSTWDYKPPQGGDTSPFRLLDFNGYDHNSRPQYVPQFQKSITKNTESAAVIITENFTTGSLLLKEVMARELTDVYIGLMLTGPTDSSNPYTYYYSTDNPISTGGNLIIGINGDNANLIANKSYKGVLFLCTAKLGSSGYNNPWSGTNFVWSYPDSSFYSRTGTITVKPKPTTSDNFIITEWKSVTSTSSYIDFTVVIKNTSSYSKTFKRSAIKCTYNLFRSYGGSYDNVFKERVLLYNASSDTTTYSIEAGQTINFYGKVLIEWGGGNPISYYGSIILELLDSSGLYDALGGYNEISYGI